VGLAVGLALAAALAWRQRRPKAPLADIERAIEAGAKLVDVRTESEFASGHLPGAINLPLGELGRRTGELARKTIVVYCHSGARSAVAAGMLRRAGFAEVLDLGAMGNWGRSRSPA